jgi:hypothetical protein
MYCDDTEVQARSYIHNHITSSSRSAECSHSIICFRRGVDSTHQIWYWVGPRAGMDILVNRKCWLLHRNELQISIPLYFANIVWEVIAGPKGVWQGYQHHYGRMAVFVHYLDIKMKLHRWLALPLQVPGGCTCKNHFYKTVMTTWHPSTRKSWH